MNPFADEQTTFSHAVYSPLLPMPTFTGPLSPDKLKEFLFIYKLWCSAHHLSSQQKKLFLPLSVKSSTAQQYFTLSEKDLLNPFVSWDEYCSTFVSRCPFDVYDQVCLQDVYNFRQQHNEPSSVYIQRIVYHIRDNHMLQEPDKVNELWRFLPYEALYFILRNNEPTSINELIELCKFYDALASKYKKNSEFQASSQFPQVPDNFSESTPPLLINSSSDTPDNFTPNIQDTIMPNSISVGTPPPQPATNSPPQTSSVRIKQTICSNCGRFNHRRNRCWNLK